MKVNNQSLQNKTLVTLNLFQSLKSYGLSGVSCPNLAPLKQDTVSFKGTVFKKSDFEGSDLAVIERYKPNIQQFKKKEDLQTFAESKIGELFVNPEKNQDGKTLNADESAPSLVSLVPRQQEELQVQGDDLKDFGGRQEETKVQRKAMLKEWFDYVIKENDAYSNTQKLVILSAITKDLKPNNDAIPPVLNKGVLAQTVTELEERLKVNPKENFDFNKMYQNNLRTAILDNAGTGETMTGWVVIPSKTNDPENFDKNVEKLKTLSHNNWCTKSFNAEPYLSKGDFHVYLENGEPKLGVRFIGNEVEEIQGERNNGKIPVNYLDTFKSYKQEQNLNLSSFVIKEIEQTEIIKEKIEKIKSHLGDALDLKTIESAEKVLNYFGINAKIINNELVVNEYHQPGQMTGFWGAYHVPDYTFSDLGIDENKLFKYIHKIYHDANFKYSNATDLGNLKEIGGDAYFNYSSILKADKLELIYGDANFRNSKVKSLKNLMEIGKNADFSHTQDINLDSLINIGGNADFTRSQIKSLGSLTNIEGNANFVLSEVQNLDNLYFIGGEGNFRHCEVTSLKNLYKVIQNLNLNNSNIKNLDNLEEVGKTIDITDSPLKSLPKLKLVGGSIYANENFKESDFKSVLVGNKIFCSISYLPKTKFID